MMRFMLRQVRSCGRLGQLTDMQESVATKSFDTPMCILYTRAGSVPYIGRDVLDRLEGHPAMINMPLGLLAENHEAIAAFPGGMKAFSAMEDFFIYCSLQDPAVVTPTGFNTKRGIPVWGRGGKFLMDTMTYADVLSGIRPDWAQSLSDCDTDINSSRKRVKKSVDNSLQYLDDLLEERAKSEKLKSIQLIGSLLGGHMIEERIRSARETVKRDVAGYTFEGLHSFGPDTEKFDLTDVEELMQKTLEELPPERPRILPGPMNPANLFTAIDLGFDIFDSSYPYLASEQGLALCYSYQLPPADGTHKPDNAKQRGWKINLKDEEYADDFSALIGSCTCYTCTHHTRAYVNHLLNVSELLAGILLNLHNLHHYLQTFAVIRRSLEDDTFSQLKEHITSQAK